MATLKEVAAQQQVIIGASLEQTLVLLSTYLAGKFSEESTARTEAVQNLQQQLNTLVGGGGDLDKVINTFNEVKAFLSDYSEDDKLKTLIDAVNSAIATEAHRATAAENALGGRITAETTRATNAESALGGRITILENVQVMTSQDASDLFDSIFNPSPSEP